VEFFRRLLATVKHCHELVVVHRDIKPDNIMLEDGDLCRPWLIDFGMVFSLEDETIMQVGESVGNTILTVPERQAMVKDYLEELTESQQKAEYDRVKMARRHFTAHTALMVAVFFNLLFNDAAEFHQNAEKAAFFEALQKT
jgi:serine/threonine protein kinase